MEAERLSRGELAHRSGVNGETIRYYEKAGLMPDPPRSAGGHRMYSQSHLKRLAFIRRCRELGFSLEEIRDMLVLVDGGKNACGEILNITRSHTAKIKSRIRDLQKMEQTLSEMSIQCSGGEAPECPIIDVLWRR